MTVTAYVPSLGTVIVLVVGFEARRLLENVDETEKVEGDVDATDP